MESVVGTSKGMRSVPYGPAWPREFEAERERIARVLGDVALRIDHVGSTSVPGLAAKPVIDIHISVAELHRSMRTLPSWPSWATPTCRVWTTRSRRSSIARASGLTRTTSTSCRPEATRSVAR